MGPGLLGIVVATGIALTGYMAAAPTPTLATGSYAQATGQSCGVCHVSPAGGGQLTARGAAFAAIPTHRADPAGAWAQMSGSAPTPAATPAPMATATPPPNDTTGSIGDSNGGGGTARYVVLAWNDLGMHCYNGDFQDIAILPPYNTLWAQVLKVGDPPAVITQGITVSYEMEDNSYSVGKTNFWSYVQKLFGVSLPDNIGLKGKGLSGTMDLENDHFVAEGIPLTEFTDSQPSTPEPYQMATIVVRDAVTGVELARTRTVAPVSTEMHCDSCHKDGGVERISTGRVATNILALHDKENQREYPAGHTGALMDRRPVLCAECHSSNALDAAGLKTGVAGVPSLSKAMHGTHADKVPVGIDGCYSCHPGPSTKCLRDVMSSQYGMDCTSCHGDMKQVASNRSPWLSEPRCDSCHGDVHQDNALYRLSKGHGGLYCAACHDSPHAIAPSSQPRDGIKFELLQGHNGPIDSCTVCHASQPQGVFDMSGKGGPAPVPTVAPTRTPLPTMAPTSTPTKPDDRRRKDRKSRDDDDRD